MIVVLLLIKNLDLKKSEESSIYVHRLGKVFFSSAFPAPMFYPALFAMHFMHTLEYTSSVKCMFLNSDF